MRGRGNSLHDYTYSNNNESVKNNDINTYNNIPVILIVMAVIIFIIVVYTVLMLK